LQVIFLSRDFENYYKSAANFCPWVAAWYPDMFCIFNAVKNQIIANNSTTTEAKEKEIQIWNP
jgi:hypothetical protein